MAWLNQHLSPALERTLDARIDARAAAIHADTYTTLWLSPIPTAWLYRARTYEDAMAAWERHCNRQTPIVARYNAEKETLAKLPSIPDALEWTDLTAGADHDDIKKAAQSMATTCTRDPLYKKLAINGLNVPGLTEEAREARALSEHYWRRRLSREMRKYREHSWMRLAPTRIKCASVDAINEQATSDQATSEFVKNYEVKNDEGKTSALPDIQKKLETQKAETAIRAKGVFEYAEERGLTHYFLTLTVPSRFHATTTRGDGIRRENPKYDGSTPTQAHAWFKQRWQAFMRYTRGGKRQEGRPAIGVIASEPHKDGAPHYHVALSIDERDRGDIERKLRKLFMDDDEAGNQHRVELIKIVDPKTGQQGNADNVISYVLKYVFKTFDAEKPENNSARAWRNTWRIRAFNFFNSLERARDSAKVTTYRQMRRPDFAHAAATAPEAAEAAKAGNWKAWMTAGKPLKIAYVLKENGFGELTTRIGGVEIGGTHYAPLTVWKIVKVEKTGLPPSYSNITKGTAEQPENQKTGQPPPKIWATTPPKGAQKDKNERPRPWQTRNMDIKKRWNPPSAA